MNQGHLSYLASPEWAQALRTDLLPWLESVAELDGPVIEVGPGPGLTTDLLRARAASVTAVEIDPELGAALAQRLAGTNVDVIIGDATQVPLPDDAFGAATCFSMLHHMPSAELQDALFATLCRVLRPGGQLIAIDSLDTERIRQGHIDDVFVPLDQDTIADRLASAGFTRIVVERAGTYQERGDQVRFHARKPG